VNESIVAAFSLVLGTATPGGGFPVFGAAFTEVINAAEPRLRIQAQNTKGSSENVPLLEAGKIDLGLIAGEYASALMAKPDTKLRVIAAMYSSPGLFVVKGDSPVRSIADLKGKPVVLGTQGSGITVLGRTVLDSLGIEINPITLEKAADGPPMLADGRAAALWGAGVGWPAFGAIAKAGGRFIAPNRSEIESILKKNPQLQQVTLPPKSYAGQDAAIPSVGSWSFVFARPDLPEGAGYLLARAIHRAEPQLAAR